MYNPDYITLDTPKNPLAVLDEKALAGRLLTHAQDGTGILGHSRPKLLEECALRLSDYSFHLKRAKRNFFWIGFSASFTLLGLCFWLASIIRGEI